MALGMDYDGARAHTDTEPRPHRMSRPQEAGQAGSSFLELWNMASAGSVRYVGCPFGTLQHVRPSVHSHIAMEPYYINSSGSLW